MKPHFEMLEKLYTPTVLLFVSFNLSLKLDNAKKTIWIGRKEIWKRKWESKKQRIIIDYFIYLFCRKFFI